MAGLITMPMLRRSAITSVIVGVLLFVVNQGRRAVDGPWDQALVARLVFSCTVPLVVSLISAILTRRDVMAERARRDGS